jgi:Domain of unknown function (DUF4203)
MTITLEGLLVGLLAVAIGLAFAFYGFRLFLILLPIWGFVAGFLLGVNAMTMLFGGGADVGLFATITSWVVGILLGLLFAVLSYLYYWVAIILLGGALGYQLTLGVFEWLNLNPDGWIAFISALVVGAIFAVGFFLLHMPAVLVIVATALLGAGTAIAGVIVGLGLIPEAARPAVFNAGIFGVYTLHDLSIIWLIAAIALAFAGAIYQTRTIADLAASITGDQYRNPGLDQTEPPTGAAPA